MHYVYELWNPLNNQRFYVGKGQGNRAYNHQREVVNGTAKANPAKISIIKTILSAGKQVEVRVVAEYRDEGDALDHEFHLIDADSTLTNIRPGGVRTVCLDSLWLAKDRLRRLYELLSKLEQLKQKKEKAEQERPKRTKRLVGLAAINRIPNKHLSERSRREISEWAGLTKPDLSRKRKLGNKELQYETGKAVSSFSSTRFVTDKRISCVSLCIEDMKLEIQHLRNKGA